jgi:hypothetical protein
LGPKGLNNGALFGHKSAHSVVGRIRHRHTAFAAPIAPQVRENASWLITTGRQVHRPTAVGTWPHPGGFAVATDQLACLRRIHRNFPFHPYSNAQLKFKRLFETAASRKNGVFMILR